MRLLLSLWLGFVISGLAMADTPIDWRRQVIYLVLVDRFVNGNQGNDKAHGDRACNNPADAHAYQGGDLAGLTSKLDYLKNLGATTVWVTPLYKGVAAKEGDNCGFPGYWADFKIPYDLSLDPRFGTASEFDQLIGDAHARHLNVILDMVVNHAGYGAEIARQRPDWFTDPATCQWQGPPEIYCSLAGLPDFDHRRRDVRDYLVQVHRQWLNRFAVDGIRMDTVKHVDPDYFGSDWIPAMRYGRPNLYVLGEILDEWSFWSFKQYLRAGFDGLFNFPLRTSLIASFAKGQSVDIAASKVAETLSYFGEQRTALMVNLLDNHDVPRFVEEIPYGIPGDDARQRYQLALTALLTLPGIPQIYYGNELGMSGGRDPYNRRFMPEWAFSGSGRANEYSGYLSTPAKIHDYVRKVLAIRKTHSALQVGRYSELWRQNGPQNANVWAFSRVDDSADSRVIVVFNNGTRRPDFPLPVRVAGLFADNVILDDHLGQANIPPIVVRNGQIQLDISGQTAAILVPRR